VILEICLVTIPFSSHVCCIWILSYVIDVVTDVLSTICKSVSRIAISTVVDIFPIILASVRPIEGTFAVLVSILIMQSLVE
jgi:hypothetical protein